jgi:hypothetical protein
MTEQTTQSSSRVVMVVVVAVLVMVVGVVLAAVVAQSDEDDSGTGNETPTPEAEVPEGPFSFTGTINYDMPTPSPALPNHEFSLPVEAQVTFEFTIDPVWEDCGFWWRVDATDSDFFYFGGHVLNEESVSEETSLPSGEHELQIGVSFQEVSEHSCTGIAEYQVTVTPQ